MSMFAAISLATWTLSLAAPQPGLPGITRIDPPAGIGALAPNLTVHDGRIYLSWLESAPSSAGSDDTQVQRRLRFAIYADGKWSEARTIVARGDFFANWADVPSLAVSADGTVFAHWLQRSGPATYAYDVVLARSTDAGVTWRNLGPLHDDGTQTEHGFVSLVPEGNGVRAFWLDGREMAAGDGGPDPMHGPGNMTLRTALITDAVVNSVVLDDRVCECCNTSAVLTADGPVILYRDRSDEEVRDLSIVRRAGARWTAPQPVHVDDWLLAGCPVNGPAADSRGSRLVIAWFTGADAQPKVRLAFSSDGGATFSEAFTVDNTWPLGRVDVVLDESGDAIVSWLDTDAADGAIMMRRVSARGRLGRPLKVTGAGQGRASGFPRLARLGQELLLVWTHEAEPTRLRAVTLPATLVAGPDHRPGE